MCGAGDARERVPLRTTLSCCGRRGEARGESKLGVGSRLPHGSQSDAYATASDVPMSSYVDTSWSAPPVLEIEKDDSDMRRDEVGLKVAILSASCCSMLWYCLRSMIGVFSSWAIIP